MAFAKSARTNIASKFSQWRSERAARIQLHSMSDTVLRDIGLTRGVDQC